MIFLRFSVLNAVNVIKVMKEHEDLGSSTLKKSTLCHQE